MGRGGNASQLILLRRDISLLLPSLLLLPVLLAIAIVLLRGLV